MRNSIWLTFVSCLFAATVVAQRTEKIYLSLNDSTSDRFIAMQPIGNNPKALLILMDGFGASPEGVLQNSKLPVYAVSQNILTIIPVLKTGRLYFGSDSSSQYALRDLILLVGDKYHVTGKPIYLGGLSIGGTCVVKYAEMAAMHPDFPAPAAVFAVDPPLDWERFYNGAKRVARLNPGMRSGEVGYMLNRIVAEMGGKPEETRSAYYEQSPYSFSDTTQRAVKTLLHTKLMLITEPDIQWWLKERHFDYSYMNAYEAAALVNELQLLGNEDAVLITTEGEGFREPGHLRHPHSWSIADPKMVINWLEGK